MRIQPKKESSLSITQILWVFTVVLVSSASEAVEMEAEFSTGVAVTDNIARTATSEIEETIRMVGLDFNLTQETRKFNATILSTFNYLDYVDNTFDSEVIGGFIGQAEYSIVDERLTWGLDYNWGQRLQDIFEPATPGNREDVSILTTGPRYVQPFGTRTAIEVEALYTNTKYETRPLDFERLGGEFRLVRAISDGKFLSVNTTLSRVEFSDDAFEPFDQADAFLRFASESERNVFEIDVGYTEVKTDGESGDGLLFRLSWNRNLSATTFLRVAGGTQYSDQGDIFRFFQNFTTGLGDTGSVSPVGSPFRNNFAIVSLSYEQDRTSMTIGAVASTEDYELEANSALDRDYIGLNFLLERQLSRKIFTRIRAENRDEEFGTSGRNDKNLTASFGMGYRFSPAISLSLTYVYFRRDSTAVDGKAIENRFVLQLGYAPRWGR